MEVRDETPIVQRPATSRCQKLKPVKTRREQRRHTYTEKRQKTGSKQTSTNQIGLGRVERKHVGGRHEDEEGADEVQRHIVVEPGEAADSGQDLSGGERERHATRSEEEYGVNRGIFCEVNSKTA